MKLLILTILGMLAVCKANPGLGYGYIAAAHPYAAAYGYNPGVATVESHQVPFAYSYGVNEQGPHYHKSHYQTANFHPHVIPVAAALPVAHAALPVAYNGIVYK